MVSNILLFFYLNFEYNKIDFIPACGSSSVIYFLITEDDPHGLKSIYCI